MSRWAGIRASPPRGRRWQRGPQLERDRRRNRPRSARQTSAELRPYVILSRIKVSKRSAISPTLCLHYRLIDRPATGESVMRRALISFVGLFIFLVLIVGSSAQQQAQPAPSGAYVAQCANCHGAGMGGASGPSILAYARYHVDAELSATIRQKHPALQLSSDVMRQVLADVRIIARTNPAMATGGYTGRRGSGPGAAAAYVPPPTAAAPAPAAAEPAAAPSGAGLTGMTPTTIKMADGRTRSGLLLGQGDLDATLLENGKFLLLARDGDVYREKPITPKADWLFYDGSFTGNRFSQLEQINTTNIKRLGPAWMFPIASSPRLEVTPTVADGVMYVGGWNEWYALDATTGRQLWSYVEPRHEGILSEGGSGANGG